MAPIMVRFLCSPYPYGVMSEDRAHILYFDYNDVESLENAVDRACNDLAAIVVSAFRHDYGKHQELPDPRFAARARALATPTTQRYSRRRSRRFRLTMHGSWDQIGVQPISVPGASHRQRLCAVGRDGNDRFAKRRRSFMPPVRSGAGATSMAAALATIDVLQAENAPEHMRRMASGCATASPNRRGAIILGVRPKRPADAHHPVRRRCRLRRGSRFVQRH